MVTLEYLVDVGVIVRRGRDWVAVLVRVVLAGDEVVLVVEQFAVVADLHAIKFFIIIGM